MKENWAMHCPSEGPEAIGILMRILEREEKEEQARLEKKHGGHGVLRDGNDCVGEWDWM